MKINDVNKQINKERKLTPNKPKGESPKIKIRAFNYDYTFVDPAFLVSTDKRSYDFEALIQVSDIYQGDQIDPERSLASIEAFLSPFKDVEVFANPRNKYIAPVYEDTYSIAFLQRKPECTFLAHVLLDKIDGTFYFKFIFSDVRFKKDLNKRLAQVLGRSKEMKEDDKRKQEEERKIAELAKKVSEALLTPGQPPKSSTLCPQSPILSRQSSSTSIVTIDGSLESDQSQPNSSPGTPARRESISEKTPPAEASTSALTICEIPKSISRVSSINNPVETLGESAPVKNERNFFARWLSRIFSKWTKTTETLVEKTSVNNIEDTSKECLVNTFSRVRTSLSNRRPKQNLHKEIIITPTPALAVAGTQVTQQQPQATPQEPAAGKQNEAPVFFNPRMLY